MKNIIFKAKDIGEAHHINQLIANEMHAFSSMMHKDNLGKGAVFAPIHSVCSLTNEKHCIGMIASAPNFDGLRIPINLMMVCEITELPLASNGNTVKISRIRRPSKAQIQKKYEFLVNKGASQAEAFDRIERSRQQRLKQAAGIPFFWYKKGGGKAFPVRTKATATDSQAHFSENTLGSGTTTLHARVTISEGLLLV